MRLLLLDQEVNGISVFVKLQNFEISLFSSSEGMGEPISRVPRPMPAQEMGLPWLPELVWPMRTWSLSNSILQVEKRVELSWLG